MKRKKFTALSLGLILSISMLAGCSSNKQADTTDNTQSSTTTQGTASGENTSGQDAYTVKILAPGDASTEDCQKVSAAASAITKEKFNTEIEVTRVGFGSYDQQVNLMLASNEKLDLMYQYCGNVTTAISSGQILPLDNYLEGYGKDLKEDISLIDLLEEIDKIEGIERIRLGSLEPKLITEEFVERLGKLKKICNHFHLSLQSGCTETLKRMNRRYTKEEFYDATKLLRGKFKNVNLTADVIVGFPGETEEEFETTYRFLEKIRFYKIHVFKYSVREGTKAAEFPNQKTPDIKEKRSKKVIELSESIQKEYNKSYIDKTLKVLFEEKEDGYYKGHTKNYICVKVKDNEKSLENLILNVKITDMENEVLIRRTD